MKVIDNAQGMSANLANVPGKMQFGVYVDGKTDNYGFSRYRIACFMYYEDAIAFAEKVNQRSLSYDRIAVERIG